jgi:hypothetical protein
MVATDGERLHQGYKAVGWQARPQRNARLRRANLELSQTLKIATAQMQGPGRPRGQPAGGC